MALIICSECGKEFSNKAVACPNCGCPTVEVAATNVCNFDDVFEANKVLKSMSRGAIKKTRELIQNSENVLYSSIHNVSVAPYNGNLSDSFSTKGKVSGVFTITDIRVLFVHSALGIGECKEIAIKDITSIDTKHSLMNCPTRIKGLTEMFIVDCSKDDQAKILRALEKTRK